VRQKGNPPAVWRPGNTALRARCSRRRGNLPRRRPAANGHSQNRRISRFDSVPVAKLFDPRHFLPIGRNGHLSERAGRTERFDSFPPERRRFIFFHIAQRFLHRLLRLFFFLCSCRKESRNGKAYEASNDATFHSALQPSKKWSSNIVRPSIRTSKQASRCL